MRDLRGEELEEAVQLRRVPAHGGSELGRIRLGRLERAHVELQPVAGALETLVAPPYDVISPQQREEFKARSPYNVVHLTLPDDEAEAGRIWANWHAAGVLADD